MKLSEAADLLSTAPWQKLGSEIVRLATQRLAELARSVLPEAPPVYEKSAAQEADQGALKPLWQALHMAPSGMADTYGGATPLASMLAGGLLSAGAGYAGGRLSEHFLGDRVLQRGKLSRNLALLGGALGALPGLYLGTANYRQNPDAGLVSAYTRPNALMGVKDAADATEDFSYAEAEEDLLAELGDAVEFDEALDKAASDTGAMFLPQIPVDQFNRAVWQDPLTPPPIRAATAGLTSTAATLLGAPVISPFDVARLGISMGTGLASGLAVGRILGGLAGLTPGAQSELQRAGVWAGALTAIVPRVFGAR